MRSPYIVATSVLVGLSTSLVVSRGPAHNSSITITPRATPTKAPSGPGLSQRQVTDWVPGIASDVIDLPENILSIIFGRKSEKTKFVTTTATYTGGPDSTTGPFTVTATVTEEPDPTTDSVTLTATVTEEPDPITHSVTVTDIVTGTVTAPGSFTTITHTVLPPVTVTTTASQSIVTTTQFTSPVPTDTTAPAPAPAPAPSHGGPGCYFPLPDGQLTVAPCGPNPITNPIGPPN